MTLHSFVTVKVCVHMCACIHVLCNRVVSDAPVWLFKNKKKQKNHFMIFRCDAFISSNYLASALIKMQQVTRIL